MEGILFTDIAKAFIEVGFPVGVAVYLLVVQSRQMERFRSALIEVQIGQRLILSKLEATDEYELAVAEFRSREENGT
jgi:hypothetical protein